MSRLLTTEKYENIRTIRVYENKLYMQKDGLLVQINKQGVVIKKYMIPTFDFIISGDIIYSINPQKYNIDIWKYNKKIATLTEHHGAINSLALDKYSNTLYSGACDKTLKIWDVNTFELITSMSYPSRVYAIKLFEDRLYVTLESKEIKVYDIHTLMNIMNFRSEYRNGFIELSNDGTKLISISCSTDYDNQIIIWDTQTGRKITKLEESTTTRYTTSLLHNDILYLGISKRISEWNYKTELRIIDINISEIIVTEPVHCHISKLCVYNNKLYSSERGPNLNIWDVNFYFTPTIECFKRLNEKGKKIIRLISHIRERYDKLYHGLPQELWFYILSMCKTYELT